jgi:hypothetical protein
MEILPPDILLIILFSIYADSKIFKTYLPLKIEQNEGYYLMFSNAKIDNNISKRNENMVLSHGYNILGENCNEKIKKFLELISLYLMPSSISHKNEVCNFGH